MVRTYQLAFTTVIMLLTIGCRDNATPSAPAVSVSADSGLSTPSLSQEARKESAFPAPESSPTPSAIAFQNTEKTDAQRSYPSTLTRRPKQALTVSAEVFKKDYISFGNNPASSPVEYYIKYSVENSGTELIEFDEIVVAWLPQNGTPLVMTTHQIEESKFTDLDDPESVPSERPSRSWVLQPSETTSEESATDGYTLDLLRDAGEVPLQLHLDFLYKGNSVVGRYVSVLPSLEDTPMTPYSDENDATKGKTLTFLFLPVDTPGSNENQSSVSQVTEMHITGVPFNLHFRQRIHGRWQLMFSKIPRLTTMIQELQSF